MTIRAVDLSGRYQIESVTANGTGGGTIKLVTPTTLNPNWFQGDLAGAGSSLYTQNITMIYAPSISPVNLNGQYTVAAVAAGSLTLDDPTGVTTDWDFLPGYFGGKTRALSANLSVSNSGNWIGPFTIDMGDAEVVVCNFVASQGLYKDDGKTQTAFPIGVEVGVTPVDDTDTPTGAEHVFSGTVQGNSTGRDQRALTLVEQLPFVGRCRIRARRTTNADYNFKGTVVDEVKWVDLFALAPSDVPDYGDVTTVHVRNYATEGATSVKERKINMRVTRKLPQRTGPATFSTILYPTNNVGDILCAIALDPLIGNRDVSELDVDSIYDAVDEASAYFGTAEAVGFNYTFDKSNTSFEEMVATIAEAIFCTAYRQGSKLKLFFEKLTPDSSLLFNHRNKVPGSETRTVRFGNFQDNDGLIYRYIDPADDVKKEIKLPPTGSVNPKTVDSVGIRFYKQAYLHAHRIWNKMRYQNVTVQFDGLQEADMLVRGERFLSADNTRHDTWDGEIVAQSILQLELSQPFEDYGTLNHSIFIQHKDGTVESISIASVTDPTHIVLATAPRLALAIGDDLVHNAAYEIAGNASGRSSAFLLTEREPQSNFTSRVTAINYDDRYYGNDQDFA
jgi:hypothetical protein